jgi:septum formation protein
MSLWLAPSRLVLASQSPVRRTMLENAGIAVEVRPADVDERAIERDAAGSKPGEIAMLLARAKARTVVAGSPGRLVLGADQTLALTGRCLVKPADRTAAAEQLSILAGRTHELHSAVTVMHDGATLFEHVDTARLTMRRFSHRFLQLYITAAGDSVSESVGGYQVEKLGSQLFESIEGDHFTILGLPLLPFLAFLRRQGLLAA